MGILTLVLESGNDYSKVEYKTDLDVTTLAARGNFTVMEISGMSDLEKHRGFDFQCIQHTLKEFEDFALAHHLKLSYVATDIAETVIVDYTVDSSSSGSFGG